MNHSTRIVIVAFLTLALAPIASHAQIRDAASKVLGNYGHNGQSQWLWAAQATNPVVVPEMTVQRTVNRAFSYDTRGQAAPSKVTAQAPAQQAAKPPRPNATRSFSYEPNYAAPRPAYVPSRGWQSGARDAGSKIRGDY